MLADESNVKETASQVGYESPDSVQPRALPHVRCAGSPGCRRCTKPLALLTPQSRLQQQLCLKD